MVTFKATELKPLGRLALLVFKTLGVIRYTEIEKDGEPWIECNNLTLINFVLKLLGPMREVHLTVILLLIQTIGSLVAFTVRYPMALFFYGKIEA